MSIFRSAVTMPPSFILLLAFFIGHQQQQQGGQVSGSVGGSVRVYVQDIVGNNFRDIPVANPTNVANVKEEVMVRINAENLWGNVQEVIPIAEAHSAIQHHLQGKNVNYVVKLYGGVSW